MEELFDRDDNLKGGRAEKYMDESFLWIFIVALILSQLSRGGEQSEMTSILILGVCGSTY